MSFFTNMSFMVEFKGQMNLFKNFSLICSPALNKCQYGDGWNSATKMSCKERVLLTRSVAEIRSNDLRKSLLCIKELTLEKMGNLFKLMRLPQFRLLIFLLK